MIDGSKGCGACREPQPGLPFTMAFQPIVDIRERRIVAHEALVRGSGGESAAAVLAAVTEDQIYGFDQACREKAIGLAAELGLATDLHINFMPRAVYEPRACIRRTLEAAQRHGFPLDRLTFEFIEHERVADPAHLLDIVEEYRRHGFKIAMDDFGTGYSDLLSLARIRPDIIKLDRMLIENCQTDKGRLAIIAAVLALGTELGAQVVIEGVERAEELAALRDAGARYMQGYLFARPIFQDIAGDADIAWVGAP
jgi:EAL domain-containing protein (putative c-di-GMP-specific phosphodiesterase class I)